MPRDERIPEEVERLKDDLIWIWHYFTQFKKLFAQSHLRVELLNEVAPLFFYTLQKVLWFEIVIGIGRLTDPYRQGSNRNLSIGILPILAKQYQWDFAKESQRDSAEELQNLVNEAIEITNPVRTWRKKLVAHRDLPTALSNAKQLEPIDTKQIEQSLIALGNVINKVYSKLTGTEWKWHLCTPQDADSLIHFLKMAIIYQDKIQHARDWQQEQNDWDNFRYKNA